MGEWGSYSACKRVKILYMGKQNLVKRDAQNTPKKSTQVVNRGEMNMKQRKGGKQRIAHPRPSFTLLDSV